jgi:hypothetical protein
VQSERPGSSIVELDEYLVCGAPDGGDVLRPRPPGLPGEQWGVS